MNKDGYQGWVGIHMGGQLIAPRVSLIRSMDWMQPTVAPYPAPMTVGLWFCRPSLQIQGKGWWRLSEASALLSRKRSILCSLSGTRKAWDCPFFWSETCLPLNIYCICKDSFVEFELFGCSTGETLQVPACSSARRASFIQAREQTKHWQTAGFVYRQDCVSWHSVFQLKCQPISLLLEGASLIGISPPGGFKCRQRKSIRNIDSQEAMLLVTNPGTYVVMMSIEGYVPSFQND